MNTNIASAYSNRLDCTCSRCYAVPDGDTCHQLYELDGENLCIVQLRERGYDVCSDCGEIALEGDLYTTEDGRYICEDCYDNDYVRCEDCGEIVRNDDTREVHNHGHWSRYYDSTIVVCTDCLERSSSYWQCEDCGEWLTDDVNCYHVEDHGDVCERCRDSYYTCGECGELFPDSRIMWDEGRDEYLCTSCYDAAHREEDHHTIHRYGYKPDPKPRTRKNCDCPSCNEVADLLFGLELEVDKGPYENRNPAISAIADACPDVYMKSDGSLDTGFEIVTHPCTLEYHTYQFKWRHITSIAKKHGFKSHDARTCGLHVHVGRYQLGDNDTARRQTIANVLMLVDRHWDAFVKFSRRQSNQLDRWARRPQIIRIADGDTEARAIEKAWAADNDNRYQAVNLCNRGTIEFRIFNGTLKRDTIIATLQLLSNVCLYAKSHTPAECLASKWSELVNFKVYDELTEYCKTQDLVNVHDTDPIVLAAPAPAQQGPEAEREIVVGDMVRITSNESCPAPIGALARVMSIDGLEYGILVPGWTSGHDLGNRLTGNDRDSGWYCYRNSIALI